MASYKINLKTLSTQRRTLLAVLAGLIVVGGTAIALMAGGKPHHTNSIAAKTDLTGIVDESFSEANAESALTAQQAELDSLKVQMKQLQDALDSNQKAHEKEKMALTSLIKESIETAKTPENKGVQVAENKALLANHVDSVGMPWQSANDDTRHASSHSLIHTTAHRAPRVHSVSFHYGSHNRHSDNHLSALHYVPSGTFVRAVVLGGADADASVNGQSKNNGVMLFKLLQPGTLPNGQRSHLEGCFVTASSYGDISSERAYVVLDKLSCAPKGQPIIDKAVTGWAFFGGKVGIKGQPLMRDNKIMQWAGISGALSGIASAAQYSQSVQSISALGSATTVPSANIAPYAAYGGASKAAEVLSNYYVKRAEQYHPVIQVGSGNLVTIVFKDGFYLEPDEAVVTKGRRHQEANAQAHAKHEDELAANDNLNFSVPPEVLNHLSNHEGVSQ